jgi:hypothetical protein
MLQVGRSWIRFPMRSLEFFNLSNPCSRTMALGSTQPLTEMSARNLSGSKGRPARKTDNLTDICELIVYKSGSLDVSHTYGPPRPLTGIVLLIFTILHKIQFNFRYLGSISKIHILFTENIIIMIKRLLDSPCSDAVKTCPIQGMVGAFK